jgi:hypothetical protein
MKGKAAPYLTVVSLESLSDFHLRELRSVMESHSAYYLDNPLGPDTVLTKSSFAAYRDQKPVGCVCLSKGADERELVMTVFFTSEKSPTVPMTLLRASSEAVMKHCPAAALIKIPILTESAEKLFRTLTGIDAGSCETSYFAVLEI